MVENLQYFPYVTTRTRQHQKGAGRQKRNKIEFWSCQKQRVQDGSNLEQRCLCQQVGVKLATRPLLSSSVKELP